MFFKAQNCPVLINGKAIIASSSDISVEAGLNPEYKVGQKATYDFYPTDGINGSWRISYLLTGYDELYQYTTSESQISGYFAGVAISGYLTDYSLKLAPNQPIEVAATIGFWHTPEGSLTGAASQRVQNLDVLNSSNVAFAFIDEKISGEITDYSFSYSRNYEPVYLVDSALPYRIVPKEISVQSVIGVEKSTINPLYSGETIYLKANINDKNGNLINAITTSGVLVSKSFSAQDNSIARTELRVVQTINQPAPSISSVDYINNNELAVFIKETTSDSSPQKVIIYGSNLDLVTAVYLQDRPIESFAGYSNVIEASVPSDIVSGNVIIESFAGKVTWPTPYYVEYLPIEITDFSPTTFNSGDIVTIYGSNLYRISEVRFGSQTGTFNVINSNVLTAYAPLVPSGYISVVSTGRKQLATASNKFYEYPIITNLSPYTGWAGGQIFISGYNLALTTKAYFNDISATISSVTDTSLIATVPTGNTLGHISIFDSNSNTAESQQRFFPTINITGIIPTGAKLGDSVIITGQNIIEPLLASMGGNSTYLVDFCGVASSFKYFHNGLSGIVPTGIVGTSGNVFIYRPDFSSVYESGQMFYVLESPPIITDVKAPTVYSGQMMFLSLYGFNLSNLTKVTLTGIPDFITTSYSDFGFDVSSSYIKKDLLGNKVNISFQLDGLQPTGKYLPIAYSLAGTGSAPIFDAITIYSGSTS